MPKLIALERFYYNGRNVEMDETIRRRGKGRRAADPCGQADGEGGTDRGETEPRAGAGDRPAGDASEPSAPTSGAT